MTKNLSSFQIKAKNNTKTNKTRSFFRIMDHEKTKQKQLAKKCENYNDTKGTKTSTQYKKMNKQTTFTVIYFFSC